MLVRAPQGNSKVICPVQKQSDKERVEKMKRFMFCPPYLVVQLLRLLKTELSESRVTVRLCVHFGLCVFNS